MITIWTTPGSPLHCELCDAFLETDGYLVLPSRDALYQVRTMETPAHLDRTCWRLAEASPAGTA